ncbi:hypothetical protein IX51_03485 [uncultured archaeon]|nr:hypothetical protein IX51_03485 [uncultured archaeon]
MGSQDAISNEKFTSTNGAQVYVSFFSYTFDILSFISIIFVIPYIHNLIYPSPNLGVSLLVTWGGVAAGSLTRPLGAAIFGPSGDNRGRKRMLYITITGSAIFTAALAGLPTYAQVGILSPVIFVALRLIAGFFIGGLIAGGLVFSAENLPERFRGLMTGFAESGGSWAHVIGSAWLLMTTIAFTGAAYAAFGWRVMFLVALLPLVVVIPVLYKIPESEIFAISKKKGKVKGKALRRLFTTPKVRGVFALSLISSIGLLGFDNLTENTFPTFLKQVNNLVPSHLAFIVLVGAAFGVIGSVLGGALSQKIGRKPLAIGGGVVLMIISVLFVYLGNIPGTLVDRIILTLIPFYFFASISKADLSLYLNEAFPTDLRASGLGLNWNIGYGLAGIWPLIISGFIAVYGITVFPLAQAVAVGILAAFYTVSSIFMKETKGNISSERSQLEAEA